MLFHFPWGLLALLAIPLILFLHFFRERRKMRLIGGLHLWSFAAIALPAGRRFDRLIGNLPLLFQILAAILLSLLLAGLDLPQTGQISHYTIILDDSVSMQARTGNTATERAVQVVNQWAKKKDRFTLISAGVRPKMLAGPFASWEEMSQALNQWTPQSPACELESSVNLASKFVTGSEKILFLTDDEKPVKSYADILEVYSLGKPQPNSCISFADRVRVSPSKDKIFITLQSFAKDKAQTVLTAYMKNAVVFREDATLAPEKPASLAFETDALQEDLVLSLKEDSLTADNSVILLPVIIKPVNVYMEGFGEASEYFRKAVLSIPYTKVAPGAAEAHLVFTTQKQYAPFETNLRIYHFLRPEESGIIALAQGRDIVPDNHSPLTEDLSLEGVLWPYLQEISSPLPPLIAHFGRSLLFLESEKNGQRHYRFNLVWDKSNIFRDTAWPTLMLAMVEECRKSIPGMDRSNFRVGEPIPLRLKSLVKEPSPFRLLKDGSPYAEFDETPGMLQDLPKGRYEMSQGSEKSLAAFSVNLFSPAESDLRSLNTRAADFAKLLPATMVRMKRNMIVFYALLILTLVFTALSWVFQD